jgi:CspA family cold shock protein
MAQERGTIMWFNNAKGYGFIKREGASDLFIHYPAIQQENGYKSLKENDVLLFDAIAGETGKPQASNVVLVEHGM